jgi:hypothetical protein
MAAWADQPVLPAIAPYYAAGGEIGVDQILHLSLHQGLSLTVFRLVSLPRRVDRRLPRIVQSAE